MTRRVKQAQVLRGETSFRGSAGSWLYPLFTQAIPDMESCALQRFYREYAYTSGTFPFMYLVAPLFEETSTPECFYSAVRAVSLATTSKQLRRYEMMQRARKHYSQALRHLKIALGDPEIVKHDGVLLALCLLCLYEVRRYSLSKSSLISFIGHISDLLMECLVALSTLSCDRHPYPGAIRIVLKYYRLLHPLNQRSTKD